MRYLVGKLTNSFLILCDRMWSNATIVSTACSMWLTKDAAKETTLSPISVCFISRCCCFFKRKKKKSGRQKWLSVTVGLGGAVQCAGNSADETVEAVATSSRIGKRGAGMGVRAGTGTAGGIASGADSEREAVTLLRVGSRSASRDSVLHTTVTITPTPTPPPLSNWIIIIIFFFITQPFYHRYHIIIHWTVARLSWDQENEATFSLVNRVDLFDK